MKTLFALIWVTLTIVSLSSGYDGYAHHLFLALTVLSYMVDRAWKTHLTIATKERLYRQLKTDNEDYIY